MFARKILSMAATAAVTLGITAGAAWSADKVSLRLNWYMVGFHAPIYMGKEKGFFSDH